MKNKLLIIVLLLLSVGSLVFISFWTYNNLIIYKMRIPNEGISFNYEVGSDCDDMMGVGSVDKVVSKEWMKDKYVVKAKIATFCDGARIQPDFEIEDDDILITNTLLVGESVTECICGHDITYTFRGLNKKEYSISLDSERVDEVYNTRQEVLFNYEVGECNDGANLFDRDREGKISKKWNNDKLIVKTSYSTYCDGVDIYSDYDLYGDLILITNTSLVEESPTRCICDYPITYEFEKLDKKDYRIEIESQKKGDYFGEDSEYVYQDDEDDDYYYEEDRDNYETFESSLMSFAYPKNYRVEESRVMGALEGYDIYSDNYESDGVDVNIIIELASKIRKEQSPVPESDDLSEYIAKYYTASQAGMASETEITYLGGRKYTTPVVDYIENYTIEFYVTKVTNDAYIVFRGNRDLVLTILEDFNVSDFFIDTYTL